MSNDLITVNEMALWTQTDLGTLAADQFATEVRSKVSDYIRFLAGNTDWTSATAPIDVRTIAIWMCKRTYTNPDQEVSSNVGPLGSRVLDEAALGMNLTESERATLQGYKDAASGSDGPFWIARITSPESILQPTVYLPDDQQVNLGDTLSWDIPMFDINDPGGPL